MNFRVKAAAGVAALMMLPVVQASASPLAPAAPPPPPPPPIVQTTNPNYVSFGDSFAANPGEQDSVPSMGGCPNSARNYSSIVGEMTGLEVRSFSCNGALAYINNPAKSVRSQVDNAIYHKALDANTRLVTISAGGNDAVQGAWLPRDVQDRDFYNVMSENISLIKTHAPNAQIMVVGYPELASAADSTACFVNVNGRALPIVSPVVRDVEYGLQERQRNLAAGNGATFVDMKQVSNSQLSMCGPDGLRHMSAAIDSARGDFNIPVHPTFVGSRVIAEQIVANYRG